MSLASRSFRVRVNAYGKESRQRRGTQRAHVEERFDMRLFPSHRPEPSSLSIIVARNSDIAGVPSSGRCHVDCVHTDISLGVNPASKAACAILRVASENTKAFAARRRCCFVRLVSPESYVENSCTRCTQPAMSPRGVACWSSIIEA